jgi:hypothetical protein
MDQLAGIGDFRAPGLRIIPSSVFLLERVAVRERAGVGGLGPHGVVAARERNSRKAPLRAALGVLRVARCERGGRPRA